MKSVWVLGCIWAVVPTALVVGAAAAHAGQLRDSRNVLPTPNPCSLLSSAEVAAAAGEAVNEGVILFRYGPTASCSFVRKGGGRIIVIIRRPPSREWAAEQVARMRQGVSLGSYWEVEEGIGERAFLFGRRHATTGLCIFENALYLQISVVGDGPEKSKILEKLARAALLQLATGTAKNGVM